MTTDELVAALQACGDFTAFDTLRDAVALRRPHTSYPDGCRLTRALDAARERLLRDGETVPLLLSWERRGRAG